LNGCSTRLGLLNQPDNASESGVGTHPAHLKNKRRFQIQTAGRQLSTRFHLEGHWFSGEAGDIHRGKPLANHAINRNAIPSQKLDTFTWPQSTNSDLTNLSIRQDQTSRFGLQLR
jgi:hypothetical protein